jgi:hypothetical protein
MARKSSSAVVKAKTGILLDLSLGGTPQPNSVTCAELGMQATRPSFPLATASVHTCVATHVLEYLEPTQVWRWFDELHRVMRPGGTVYLSGPYGGDESAGWLSDPSHRVRVVEQTFAWLDPRLPFYAEHPSLGRPLPKPWHVLQATRVPGTHGTWGYNVVLQAQGATPRKARR